MSVVVDHSRTLIVGHYEEGFVGKEGWRELRHFEKFPFLSEAIDSRLRRQGLADHVVETFDFA